MNDAEARNRGLPTQAQQEITRELATRSVALDRAITAMAGQSYTAGGQKTTDADKIVEVAGKFYTYLKGETK